MQTVQIDLAEYRELIKAREELALLEMGGVDNWIGYEDALYHYGERTLEDVEREIENGEHDPLPAKVNINRVVKIKLTKEGLDVLKEQHKELYSSIPIYAKGLREVPEFTPPKEDKDGYTHMQLWWVMQRFGPYITVGSELLFETEIIL